MATANAALRILDPSTAKFEVGADSGRNGALVPIEVGQSFRSKWGADSGGKWGTFWLAP